MSGGGTNLQALINAQKKGIIKSGKIVTVLSDKADAYALTRAKDNGIDTKVILKQDFGGDRELFSDALCDFLTGEKIDLVVLAGFMSILSGKFLSIFKDRIINVHPSLIPSFCGDGYYGLKVHKAALDYGVKVTGATVHLVNEVTDGGKILLQKAVYIEDGDTPETLQKRVMEQAEWEILPQAVEMFCSGKIK